MKNKKNKNITILSILVLFMVVGFAYLSTNLSINGQTLFKKVEWNIYLDNIVEIKDSTNSGTAEVNTDKDTINFNATLNTPGDIYEFTFDVINDGTVDAVLDSIVIDDTNLPTFMEVSAIYSDGEEITPTEGSTKGDILSKKSSEKIKVIVKYKENISVADLPSEPGTTNMSITLNYAQHKVNDNGLLKVYYNHNFNELENRLNYYRSLTQMDDGTIISEYNSETEEYDLVITPSKDVAEFEVGTLRRVTGRSPEFLIGYSESYIKTSDESKIASYKDYYETPSTDVVELIYKYEDDNGHMQEILPINDDLLVNLPDKLLKVYIRILNGNGNSYTIDDYSLMHVDIDRRRVKESPLSIYYEYVLGGACVHHTATGWFTSKELTTQVTSLKGIKNNQMLYADTTTRGTC